MNKKQVRVIWIGIVLFLLAIPIRLALQIHLYGGATTLVWICFFLSREIPAVIALITIGLFVTFRDKKDDNPKDDQNNKQGNR